MKTLNFKNSSSKIRSLLSTTSSDSVLDVSDFCFSTFRSDDYHFYEGRPHAGDTINDNSNFTLGDLSGCFENQEEMEDIRKRKETRNIRKMDYRNRKSLVQYLLGLNTQKKGRKGLNFVNKSTTVSRILGCNKKVD